MFMVCGEVLVVKTGRTEYWIEGKVLESRML
jgi:hypothetical protein